MRIKGREVKQKLGSVRPAISAVFEVTKFNGRTRLKVCEPEEMLKQFDGLK